MAQSFKVLHVLNGASGGAAMSTIALIEDLKAYGIGACAVCDDRGTGAERARLRDAVEGEVLFTPLYWWNRKIRSALWKRPFLEALQLVRTGWQIRSTEKIVRAACCWQPKLVHTNTLLTPEGGRAARKLGIPHVWHVRELIGKGMPFQLNRAGHALGAYLIDFCDRVIANSEVTAAQIAPWLPPGFVAIVPNGIDCSSFASPPKPTSPDRVVVAMVANLSSRVKKHHLFIEAAGRTDSSLPIEWRIYGHDPSNGGKNGTDSYVNSMHGLARAMNIEHKLTYPGHLPPEQIMSEIDFLVHPTEVESFGRVVVEAMAAGVPVIGAAGGGVAEIIIDGETGLLFRPNDSNDLARCLERMIRDHNLSGRCAAEGRIRANRHYSIKATSQRVAHVYDEVLHDCHRSAIALNRETERSQAF